MRLVVFQNPCTEIDMLVDFTLGIGSNLVTELIQRGGREFLDGTRLGVRLKERVGLLDDRTKKEFRKLLLESYATYFARYPDRQFQAFYDFFLSEEVNNCLFNYVFNFQPIDYQALEDTLRHRMGGDWLLIRILDKNGLTLGQVIADFIDCYAEVEKQSSGTGLLFAIRQIRESEQRVIETITLKVEDVTDEIVSSVVGNFRDQLAALKSELKQMGIGSTQLPILESLSRDAVQVELAIHEVQIYLQAIIANADNLSVEAARSSDVPEALGEYSDEVFCYARMLYYSILNLMRYTEIAGYRFRRLNIGSVLQEIAALYAPLAKRKDIEIRVESCHKRFPSLEISIQPIELAINNLLQNAIRFSLFETSKMQRQVKIVGKRAGRFYKLSFTNYGIGILPEEYDRIFEDGYRGILARGKYRTGTGRGLYVVKVIVERHHGRIHVRSEKHGEGYYNTFEVYLPYRQPTQV
jgi:signal transduction histidine kinase